MTAEYKDDDLKLFFGLLESTLKLEDDQFNRADLHVLQAIRTIAKNSKYVAEKAFLERLFAHKEKVNLFAFILQSYVRTQYPSPSFTDTTTYISSSFYELHKALAEEFVHSLDQGDTNEQSKRFEVVMNAVRESQKMLEVFNPSSTSDNSTSVIPSLQDKATAVNLWWDKVSCGEKCIPPSAARAFDKVGVALWLGLAAMCLVAAVLLLANPVGAGMGAAAFTTVVAMNLLGASSGIINVASGVRNLLKPSQPVKDRAKVEKKATAVENGLFSKPSSEKQDAEKAQPTSGSTVKHHC